MTRRLARPISLLTFLPLFIACAGNGGEDHRSTPTEAVVEPSPTPSASISPTWTVTPTPTATPTTTASASPTVTVTPTATAEPSPTPTPSPDCERPGTICTVAGTGKSLFDGDGRDALQTSLYFPYDVAFDPTGRPLILDWNNLRLRRINADNTVETIAGIDVEAAPMEGALARESPLHHASDVELDASGAMYIADYHVPLVFRVNLDARIEFVAGNPDELGSSGDGGPARAALLTKPFGVFPTLEGGVFVSDAEAHVIRYVRPDGIITAVAGRAEEAGFSGDGGPATAALLNGPARLRLDAAGNLVFCDTNNHVVRRVDTSGTITTIAGSGRQGFGGDGGPATAADLDSPYDLRIDGTGTMYIIDTGNNVVRRLDPNGTITTIAGDGEPGYEGDGGDARTARFDRPTGIEIAPDGSLWIADTLNHRVRRIAGVTEP